MKHALLVINFQDRYRTDGAYGSGSAWLGNVLLAMDAAVRTDAPILLIRQVADSVRPSDLRRANPLWGIHPEIIQRNWDGLIDMCGRDIFAHPGLTAWLTRNSIEVVTLCGHMADSGGELAARRARHFGYSVEVLSDAIRTSPYGQPATDGAESGSSAGAEAASSGQIVTAEWVQRLGTWRRWSQLAEGVRF